MAVHPSGYYVWKAEPASARDREDQRLLGLIKHAWLESGGVYGYRKSPTTCAISASPAASSVSIA